MPGNYPLVSIIIPAFNVERYIQEAVESVLNQDYNNIEIIIVNDGSTDNTSKICMRLSSKDNRIRLVNKKNGGAASARNLGIRESNGDFIMFLDGDDFYSKHAVSSAVSLIEKNKSDLVCFDFDTFNENGILPRPLPNQFPSILSSSGIDCVRFIYQGFLGYFSWAFLYRSSVLKGSGISYPEDIHVLEDAFFLNLFLRHVTNVSYLNECIYHYRVIQNSLTRRVSPVNAKTGISSIQHIMSLAKKDNLLTSSHKHFVDLLLFMYELNGNSHSKLAISNRNLIKKIIVSNFIDFSQLTVKQNFKVILILTNTYYTFRSFINFIRKI